MALRIVEGAIAEIGTSTSLTSQTGPTGTAWSFVRFDRPGRPGLRLEQVRADPAIGARIRLKQTGRFAFYAFDGQAILCGFAGPERAGPDGVGPEATGPEVTRPGGIEIARAETDPAILSSDTIRLPAKRKIFWGVVMIPTIIGLFFAFDMIRAGRAQLRAHPAPKRPREARLMRALKGQWWLFW